MNNNILVIGRIYKDLELRSTSNGKYVLDLPLAITNAKDDTTFLTITIFDKNAENCKKFCKKGDLISARCIIKNHNWEDKDGKKHYDYQFLGDRVTFLNTKKEDVEKSNEDDIPLTDDMLPF